MTDGPSAEEAAAALRNVDHRKDQALDSQRGARWVYAVFGVVMFLCLASNDFLPSSVSQWSTLAMAALLLVYVAVKRTRRGAALLGYSAQFDRRAVPPKFAIVATLVIILLVALSFVAIALHVRTSVPYLSTGLGAVVGIALIGFGPQLQSGLNALAKRSR